ncbi:MAG TPA: hypothetical protein VIY53_15660 [Acidobacteriaceae bacterium]
MRFLKGILGGGAGIGSGILLTCLAAAAQTQTATPLPLEHRTAEQMSAGDAALIQEKHAEIANEARFWGYDLSAGGWTYDQVVCPEVPDDVLLHYRGVSPKGAKSLFTALIPRGAGRVQVVPVLYHNATPYEWAPAAPRTIAVFNRALPAPTAEQLTDPQSDWIALAMTYAALAGGDSEMVMGPNPPPAAYLAPRPTAEISVRGRVELVRFTEHDRDGLYSVWGVSLDQHGRVTAANMERYPAPIAEPGAETPEVAASALVPEGAAPTATSAATAPETSAPAPFAGSSPAGPESSRPAPAATATNAPAVAGTPVASSGTPNKATGVSPAAPPSPAAVATSPSEPTAPSPEPAVTSGPIGKLIPPGPPPKWRLIPQGPPLKEIPIPPAPTTKQKPVPQE